MLVVSANVCIEGIAMNLSLADIIKLKRTEKNLQSTGEELMNNYESEDKMVSHPGHYQSSKGIEVIDVIAAFTESLRGIEATDTGNIIKYACRWNNKGNPVQDVEKIIWYATHLLNELKSKERSLGYTE